METLTTNRSTVILDDLGRWVAAYGNMAPDVGNPHVGAKYFDLDDSKEYYWTGSTWSEVKSNPNFNAEYWDDLRFPAAGFNPAGSTAPPTVDTATGLLSFAGNADNIMGGVAQMPHAWKFGSPIYPHLHLLCATSNAGFNSRWKFEYNMANNNADFGSAYGAYTTLATITIANPANAARLVYAEDDFGALSMTNMRDSAHILWRLTRLAASDAADNDTSAWILLELDFHYQLDKTGTANY